MNDYKENDKSNTLSKILWTITLVAIVIGFAIFCYSLNPTKDEVNKHLKYKSWVGNEISLGFTDRGIIEDYAKTDNNAGVFKIRYKKDTKKSLLSASASLIGGSNDEKYGYMVMDREVVEKLNPGLNKSEAAP